MNQSRLTITSGAACIAGELQASRIEHSCRSLLDEREHRAFIANLSKKSRWAFVSMLALDCFVDLALEYYDSDRQIPR